MAPFTEDKIPEYILTTLSKEDENTVLVARYPSDFETSECDYTRVLAHPINKRTLDTRIWPDYWSQEIQFVDQHGRMALVFLEHDTDGNFIVRGNIKGGTQTLKPTDWTEAREWREQVQKKESEALDRWHSLSTPERAKDLEKMESHIGGSIGSKATFNELTRPTSEKVRRVSVHLRSNGILVIGAVNEFAWIVKQDPKSEEKRMKEVLIEIPAFVSKS